MQGVVATDCRPVAALCFDDENARDLLLNIVTLQDWIEEAWVRCQPESK